MRSRRVCEGPIRPCKSLVRLPFECPGPSRNRRQEHGEKQRGPPLGQQKVWGVRHTATVGKVTIITYFEGTMLDGFRQARRDENNERETLLINKIRR
jgi:hypothetical protein